MLLDVSLWEHYSRREHNVLIRKWGRLFVVLGSAEEGLVLGNLAQL